jgi:HTH-type transcriptional regulator / antitoxin HigA
MGVGRGFESISLKSPSSYYLDLINAFPPRPITNVAELEATQLRINVMLDRAVLTVDDRDYLKVLGMLVYEYEERAEGVPRLRGVDFLRSMIEDMGLKPLDLLPIFGDEEMVLDVLNERVAMSVEQVQQLAEFFRVSPQSLV